MRVAHSGSAGPWTVAIRLGVAFLASGHALDAHADALRQAERDFVNFAFATQLGSGIYTVDGRTVQIYRLPFARQLSEAEDGRPGVRLALPVTVGLFDFKLGDIVEEGIPRELETLSAAFGIELDFPLGESWHLLPYAEAGHAWDFHSDQDAVLYSVALHARRDFELQYRLVRFNAGAVHAAVDLRGAGGHSSLSKLETGVEARWTTDRHFRGHRVDWGPYGVLEWYADRPDEPVARSSTSRAIPLQAEVGFTVGTRTPAKLWGIPVPRVGFGYRFGDGLSAYRLAFGAPF